MPCARRRGVVMPRYVPEAEDIVWLNFLGSCDPKGFERGLERAVARRGQFALIEIMLRAVDLEDARALRLGIQGRQGAIDLVLHADSDLESNCLYDEKRSAPRQPRKGGPRRRRSQASYRQGRSCGLLPWPGILRGAHAGQRPHPLPNARTASQACVG
jgi:hypothetical protein